MRKSYIRLFLSLILCIFTVQFTGIEIVSAEDVTMEIESKQTYFDMASSYSEGYKPIVKDGKVSVVLPLAVDDYYNYLTAIADVGAAGPFIAANQRKQVEYSHYDLVIGKFIYVAVFELELAGSYDSGTYAVNFSVNGSNSDTRTSGNFTVYVVLEEGKGGFELAIANDKVYKGMNRSYQDGYIPTIEDDMAKVVLPLKVMGDYSDTLSVTARTTDSTVFSGVNYNKTFSKQGNGIYLVAFELPLEEERKNGAYPVEFTVTARNKSFSFTVYVIISDSKNSSYKVSIINDIVYKGMNQSYQDGYIPTVEHNTAKVMLPLSVSEDYKGALSVTSRTTDSTVFSGVNYSKQFNRQGDGNYLVTFELPLKEGRKNGSYPVEFTVTADSTAYNFTVYVIVTDEVKSGFFLDNQKVYDNMDVSYANGYKPTAANGRATVILPIKAESNMQGDIKVKADITDNTNETFDMRNYEKMVSLNKDSIYLARFDFNLLSTRKNGVYTAKFIVSGNTAAGEAIEETFTIYITVSDAADSDDDTVPNIIVEGFSANEYCLAGEEFVGVLTLKNISKNTTAHNIQIRVSEQNQGLEFVNNTNTIYQESIGSNSLNIDLKFKALSDAPTGKNSVNLDISYEDENGSVRNLSAVIYINIRQVPNVELETKGLDDHITAGDTVSLTTDVYNIGKGSIYNVTLKVEGDGLLPNKSGYIGTMNAESSESVSIDVFVGSKTMSSDYKGEEKYGFTEGKIILTYEDSEGNEYMKEHKISTQINVPASSEANSSSTVTTENSWWISLIAGGCILIFTGVYLFFVKTSKKWSVS